MMKEEATKLLTLLAVSRMSSDTLLSPTGKDFS